MDEKRKAIIVRDGNDLRGNPIYFLDSEDGMNERGDARVEWEDHMAGFFHTEAEAREWAERKGFIVEE